MQALRKGSMISAGVALALLAGAATWKLTETRERDAAVMDAVRSVRAGLLCATGRGAELPDRLDAGALPGICRLLAGTEALSAADAGQMVGYRKLTPHSYRICAALSTPDLIGRLGSTPARVECLEETLLPGHSTLPHPPRRTRTSV